MTPSLQNPDTDGGLESTRRTARLKRLDRAAVAVITAGGIGVVLAVLGILLFVGAEALPLFRAATMTPAAALALPQIDAAPRAARTDVVDPGSGPAGWMLGTDEYLRNVLVLQPDGLLRAHPMVAGQSSYALVIPGLDGARVTSATHTLLGDLLGIGMQNGRAVFLQARYEPVFAGGVLRDVTVAVTPVATGLVDPAGRALLDLSIVEQDGELFAAARVSDDEIAYWRRDADATEHHARLRTPDQDITHVRVGRNGHVIAGTSQGRVFHWEAGESPVLTDVSPVADEAITALEWMIGGNSFVAGTARGEVSSWFRAPVGGDETQAMVRAHDFESQGAAVVAIAVSPRDRSFATAGADGSILLRHQTSERTLARVTGGHVAQQLLIAPRANEVLARREASIERYHLDNPHPEISWQVLFGKVWYESYAQPEYVWQSTGGTDDFEPKFSLVPLVFGTLKGTFYALLFAIPLAVGAALYTSQFATPALRNRIKPTVEIMAALPSVVIGFLAGLYLATVVERNLAAVFLSFVLMPVFGTSGALLWLALPKALVRRLPAGAELLAILLLLAAAGGLAFSIGPWLEATLLGTDIRQWLLDRFGITYDQRNSLVVGLAMGFAVIPIIFTISEDAFSSVPSNLTAASLALGASRWQTAVRIVLPTASPGIFSAVMIGFGRAVGETMIVLMATGNTPVLDWSMFNGMRTLSANIAVEIPEAPHGGTLYRVLFLAATLLFVLTFAVNTVAEIVRQRLRERYKAI